MAKKNAIKPLGRQTGDALKSSAAKRNREEPAPTGRTFSSGDPLILDFDGNHYVEADLQCMEAANVSSENSEGLTPYAQADAPRAKADAVSAPPNFYIANLTHFLTEKGVIAPTSGPAKRFANILTMLVAAATASPSAKLSTSNVDCFRRPGNMCCRGTIETVIAQDGAVLWMCPACESRGIIRNWRGTLWDCSRDATAH